MSGTFLDLKELRVVIGEQIAMQNIMLDNYKRDRDAYYKEKNEKKEKDLN